MEGSRRRLAAMTVALSPALVALAARVAVADPPKAAPPTPAKPHPVARPTPAPRKTPPPAETATSAPSAGPTAEAPAVPAAPDAGISTDAGVIESKTLDGGTRVFKFSELEIEGHLKSPQLVYFLRRVRAEFAAGDLGHRSFLREMSETRKEPSF